MSHFEYVSVAVALIYALAVGRLLSGLSFSLTAKRQYWVHTVWVFTLLLISVISWWAIWGLNGVTWTPGRFLWILCIPSLIYLRANILLGRPGDEPDSYYEYFYAQRRLFFSVGIVVAVWIALTPWVQGLSPWFELERIHFQAVMLASVSLLGLWLRHPTVHAVLAVLTLVSSISFFLIARVTA